MMTSLWIYEGELDASTNVLTLMTEGPSFADDGTLSKYKDVIEIMSGDHRTLSSNVFGGDGSWTGFMTAHYRKVK